MAKASDCGSEDRGFKSHRPPHKNKRYPNGYLLFLWHPGDRGLEPFNATDRWTVACRRLDGGNTIRSSRRELRQQVPSSTPEKVPDLIRFSSLVFLFYVGMIPGIGCCSNFFRCIGFWDSMVQFWNCILVCKGRILSFSE